ncbi:MAG TPA: alpha/beta fold hydrolase [Nocardioides sp.]|nr:alpha/beta fold hydrolase [Nocardioides sp.]
MLSRRALLAGGVMAAGAGAAGGVGMYEGVLPGRPRLQSLFGLNGEAGVVPDVEPGPILTGSFVSEQRLGEETGWSLMRPPGTRGQRLPLVVSLHALGWNHDDALSSSIGLPQFLAQAVDRGVPPFAIATVDGGRSYWHHRPSGEDAGAMVVDELLPLLGRHAVGIERIGLLGWSMGGYGVLRLATDLGPERVAAVVAASPAVWRDPADARPDGFEDEEEYEQYSVMDSQDLLDGIPVRIDVGTGDPLYREVEEYVDGFPDDADLTSTFEPGGHSAAYWRRMLPAQVEFLGTRVA